MPDSEFVSCITDAKKVSAEMAHFVARPAQWRSIHCLLLYSDSAFSTCVPGSVSAHRASPSSQLFLQPHPPPSVQSPITGPIKTSCLLKILHPFSPSPVSTSWSSYRPNRITYLPPSGPPGKPKSVAVKYVDEDAVHPALAYFEAAQSSTLITAVPS